PGLGGDDRRTRVATAGGRIAGFATSVPAGGVIELDDLFVDPAWMRRGGGRGAVVGAGGVGGGRGGRRRRGTADQERPVFYGKAGFVADHEVRTRFGPGTRMHLDVSP